MQHTSQGLLVFVGERRVSVLLPSKKCSSGAAPGHQREHMQTRVQSQIKEQLLSAPQSLTSRTISHHLSLNHGYQLLSAFNYFLLSSKRQRRLIKARYESLSIYGTAAPKTSVFLSILSQKKIELDWGLLGQRDIDTSIKYEGRFTDIITL